MNDLDNVGSEGFEKESDPFWPSVLLCAAFGIAVYLLIMGVLARFV